MPRNILITRPEPSASEFAEKIRSFGDVPIVAPLTKIVQLHPKSPVFREYGCLLATSANAIVQAPFGLSGIENFMCVGRRTAEVGQRVGLPEPIYIGADVDDLIGRLRLYLTDMQPILYIAGRQRMPELEYAMDNMQLTYALCETYSAPATDNPLYQINMDEIDVVTLFSERAAQLFLEALDKSSNREYLLNCETRFFCLSFDIAHVLLERMPQLAPRIKYPREANMKSMLKLMRV